MIFGPGLVVAQTAAPAERWLDASCQGEPWTVGALVPNHYRSLLRLHPPSPDLDDWWSAYRSLFEVVASIGERHTSTPERAWFAIWDGHGFAEPTALRRTPRLARPDRSYHLVTGSVGAVTGLHYPDGPQWRNPDLFWPDDRRWFVATDVDFWSLYVGGSDELAAEIAEAVPTRVEPVTLDLPLEIEN